MKILVTGGAGFIGSNFIHYWLNKYEADQIINLDKLTYAGNLANLETVAKRPNYQFIQGDICDQTLVRKLMTGVDLVVHFAAESHVDRSIESSVPFIETNVVGTQVLLAAAREAGNVRFHHVSTDEVYGSLTNTDPRFTETTPYDPRSPYSASKASSDHLVRSYYYTHKLPITVSNCSNNFGPYQFTEKLIPLFITNLIQGKKVPVYGSGKNIRDWIYVDDHNYGLDLIIKQGRIGETYLLGGNNEKTNLEITDLILDIMGYGKEMIEYVPDRLGHDFRYAIDYAKAEKELGFSPQHDFRSALEETIKWYQEHQSWWKK